MIDFVCVCCDTRTSVMHLATFEGDQVCGWCLADHLRPLLTPIFTPDPTYFGGSVRSEPETDRTS